MNLFRDKKVYIIPTYNGFVLLGLVMFCVICATSSGNNLLYLLSILLGGMVLITMIQAHQNVDKLGINEAHQIKGEALNKIEATFSVTNPNQAERHCISIELKNFTPLEKNKYSPQGFSLFDYSQNMKMTYSGKKRGVYKINRAKITSIYPFGLWRVWMWVPVQSEALIYPKPRGEEPLQVASSKVLKGDAANVSGGDDFSELKRYTEGENPHHIDWRSVARGHAVMVKKFNSGGVPIARIDWNLVLTEETEKKLEQLSQWLLLCEKAGTPFIFKTPYIESETNQGANSSEGHEELWRHLASFGEEKRIA